MQHLLCPAAARCGRQLEHRPPADSATKGSRAVKIAGGIEDQASVGPNPVRSEALEHRPVTRAGSTAKNGGAVQIAGAIEDQAGGRKSAVRADAVEVIQHLLRPGPAC